MGFIFDKCCFCIDLRTGCLIIGYLNLITEIALIFTFGFGLVGASVVSAVAEKQETRDAGTLFVVLLAILLILFILFFAFTIVLLVGLHQYKRGHVKIYLIYALILLVIYTIAFFASFAVPGISAATIVRDLISILFGIYFFLVIRSYYVKMDDPANKPAVYNTA